MGFRQAVLIGTLSAIMLVSACVTSASPSIRRTPIPARPTLAVAPCDAGATREVVGAFLVAYNTGADDIVDRFIAGPEKFRWYADPTRQYPQDPAATDRLSLTDYFAYRYQLGDRLELVALRFNGTSNGNANFDFVLVHIARGEPSKQAEGKGAIDCVSRKLVVWRIEQW